MLKNKYEKEALFTSCSLIVTEQCNLRCTYCFERHKDNYMDQSVAKNSIDYLFNNAILTGNSVSITFFGGEPTMNPDIIIYSIEYGRYLSQQFNIPVSFGIITNCVFLPENLEEYLLKNIKDINFSIQLSIDGMQEVQDEYRITRNGKPSYHLVEKTIEKWKNIARQKKLKISMK